MSVIKLSELIGARRIDAEAYRPEMLNTYTAIAHLPHVQLDAKVAFVTDGQHGYHEIDEDSEIKHLTARCIKNGYIDTSNADRISEVMHARNQRSACAVGDVLLSTAGTIGNAGVVTADVLPANMDQDVARIKIHDEKALNPWYVAAFLNSRFGRLQAERESTGQVQQHLALEKVRQLRIPLLTERDSIAQQAQSSFELFRKSEGLYALAQALLTAELGLDQLDLSDSLFSVRQVSEVQQARRIDAEHFKPKYQRVMTALHALKPKGIVPLGSLLITLANGHTPLHHDLSIGDIPFLTAEHVFDFRVNYDSDKRILAEHHRDELENTQLFEGDVLITIKGRIGNAAVVETLPGPTNINQDLALLRFKPDLHPWYIVGFLNSPAGKALTEQISTGQINPFLGLGSLSKVPIPLFAESRMNDLGQELQHKVAQAYRARQDARRLLTEAKAEVERLIEGK